MCVLCGVCMHMSDKCPPGLTSRTPWRKVDADYVNNEVYFDIVESLDAILDANETVIRYACIVNSVCVCVCVCVCVSIHAGNLKLLRSVLLMSL